MSRRSLRFSRLPQGIDDTSASDSGPGPSFQERRTPAHAAEKSTSSDAFVSERRFEDILAGEEPHDARVPEEDCVESHSFGLKKSRSRSNIQQKRQRAVGKPSSGVAAPRKARKTLGEEVGDEGLIFTREGPSLDAELPSSRSPRRKVIPDSMGPPPLTASVRMPRGAGPSSSSITFTRLPEGAETPIIRRNREFRAQADVGPAGTRSSQRGSRRNSLGLKSTRRVSMLSSGAPAHPHTDVPDWELFRHCSGTLLPHERMRHLAAWILSRSTAEVVGGQADTVSNLVTSQLAKTKTTRDPAHHSAKDLSPEERRHLARAQRSLEVALERTLADLSGDKLDVDWATRAKSSSNEIASHPRNIANADAAGRLEGVLASIRVECSAWEAERQSIEDLKRETAEICRAHAQQRQGNSRDALAPQLPDFDFHSASLDKLQATQLSDVADARERSQASQDSRWNFLQFKADVLLTKANTLSQLSEISSRVAATVSARAAVQLRALAGMSTKLHAVKASESSDADTAGFGIGGAAASTRESRENVEALLRGVSSNYAQLKKGIGADNSGIWQGSPDDSGLELLRALAAT